MFDSPPYSPSSSTESFGLLDPESPALSPVVGTRFERVSFLARRLTAHTGDFPVWTDPEERILAHALQFVPIEHQFGHLDLPPFSAPDLVHARNMMTEAAGWLHYFIHHRALVGCPVSVQLIAHHAMDICAPLDWAHNPHSAPTDPHDPSILPPYFADLPDEVRSSLNGSRPIAIPEKGSVPVKGPITAAEDPSLVVEEPVASAASPMSLIFPESPPSAGLDAFATESPILFASRDVAMASPSLSPVPFLVKSSPSLSAIPFGSQSAPALSHRLALPPRPASVGSPIRPLLPSVPIGLILPSCPNCTAAGYDNHIVRPPSPQFARRGRRRRRPAFARAPISSFNLETGPERRSGYDRPASPTTLFVSPVHAHPATRDLEQQRNYAAALSTHLHNQSIMLSRINQFLHSTWDIATRSNLQTEFPRNDSPCRDRARHDGAEFGPEAGSSSGRRFYQ
ncbi:hypothetical protein C8J56DRAFT_1055232 [Mycena floridula]|nr:hypothetical protein C8J56DRAFT_1055232 [Mycena floridula]